MTFPNYPGQIPQGGYPAQPSYAQPGYPPQQPPQPQYQQPPGQFHTQQYPPQPPAPELPRGTLKDFMDQPAAGGGPSLTFPHPGTAYTGTVLRNVTDADVQAQTDMITGQAARYNDGRYKLVMRVPLAVQPSAQFPEGTAVWYVKGNDRAELTRAMEEAGVETDPATGRLYPPRAGDTLTVTYTHDQPGRRGMNPTKVKRVQYVKGNGQAPVVQAQQQAQPQYQPQAQYPVQPQYAQPAPQPQQQYPGAPQYTQTAPGTVVVQPPNIPPGFTPAPPQYMPVPQYQAPDPAQAYQQATGQPMPQQYAQPQQQAPFPTQGAPAAPTAPTPGAQPTAPASPSSPAPAPAPLNSPPPDWPADVPFIPGLTAEQARVAATLHHPSAQ